MCGGERRERGKCAVTSILICSDAVAATKAGPEFQTASVHLSVQPRPDLCCVLSLSAVSPYSPSDRAFCIVLCVTEGQLSCVGVPELFAVRERQTDWKANRSRRMCSCPVRIEPLLVSVSDSCTLTR